MTMPSECMAFIFQDLTAGNWRISNQKYFSFHFGRSLS